MNAALVNDPTRANDPWGKRWAIRCEADYEIVVTSAGPDGMFGTRDDVVIPGPYPP